MSDATETIQRVQIDEVGPSLNDWYSGSHWSLRKKHKSRWRLLVREAIDDVYPVKIYPARLRVTCTFSDGRRVQDASNLAATAKLAEDALCFWGILADDDPDFVASVQLRSRKGDARKTVIEIIEDSND